MRETKLWIIDLFERDSSPDQMLSSHTLDLVNFDWTRVQQRATKQKDYQMPTEFFRSLSLSLLFSLSIVRSFVRSFVSFFILSFSLFKSPAPFNYIKEETERERERERKKKVWQQQNNLLILMARIIIINFYAFRFNYCLKK